MTGPDGSFTTPRWRWAYRRDGALARGVGGDRVRCVPVRQWPEHGSITTTGRDHLKPGREVAVRVSDSNHVPIAGATVQAAGNFAILDAIDYRRRRIRQAEHSGRRQGRVDFCSQSRGEALITPNTAGSIPTAARRRVRSQQRYRGSVALLFDGASTVRLKAVDRDGKPLAGIQFYPWLLQKEGRRSQRQCGEPGLAREHRQRWHRCV